MRRDAGKIIRRAGDLQDLSRLSQNLLSTLMETADAVFGTVWVLEDDQSFRQVVSRGKPGQESRGMDPGGIIHRHEEISRGIPFFEQSNGKVVLNSLFLPIRHQDILLALVHLETGSRGGNALGDTTIAQLQGIVEDYAVFLNNARVLDRIRKNPLKDLESGCYNESFILDFLKRQITLSRRFNRRLGIINLEYEGAEQFQRTHSYGLVQGLTRDISETLQGILRDFDVVAHVGNFRFIIGLPETDSLGCRITIERLRRGFARLPYLEERFGRYALKPHFGFSCYPEDGLNEEVLIMKMLERAKANRSDPLNRIHWSETGFWDLVAHFTTDTGIQEITSLDWTEPTSFEVNFAYLLQEAAINNVLLSPDRRGLLYIGSENALITEALVTKNPVVSRTATRITVLGDLSGVRTLKEINITTVSLPPEQSKGFQFLLLLTDQTAYALVGVHFRSQEWRGFPTSNDRLVEKIVFRLREEYSLQEQV